MTPNIERVPASVPAGRVFSILKNWPERRVKAICLTDGERVGALGDLGVQVGLPKGSSARRPGHAGRVSQRVLAQGDLGVQVGFSKGI